MSLLRSLLLFGLLNLLLPDAQAFTVELTQADTPGIEGGNVEVTVRLVGQILGSVEVTLDLLTLSQLPEEISHFTLSEDPAESDDFSHDDPLVHTFNSVSSVRQTTDFIIDIVDDHANEEVEQFIVVVRVTDITNNADDYSAMGSERTNATVTIRIDTNAPDTTKLSISAPPGGTTRVAEGTTGWALSLKIEEYPPEYDIDITITTQQTTSNPAVKGSDYRLGVSSVTLTPNQQMYNVTIDFINDEVPEPEIEGFEVIMSVASGANTVNFFPRSSISITIEDDDWLTVGFSHTQLTIREGESATAKLFIMSSELVAVTLSGDVAHALSQLTTAESGEVPDAMSFTLNQENRDFSFTISIPSNDEISRSRERVFTLGVQDISAISDKYRITPHQLGILIKDNDTDVEFGIRDVVPGEPRQVEEGKSLTFTIGFLEDDIELDSDFILGYSVKISATVAGDVGTNFVTTDISDGVLSSAIRSRDITVETKTNDEVEDDRTFTVVVEHTTTEFNPSSLVKLISESQTMSVIITDDDFNPPAKPSVSIIALTDTSDGRMFEISWKDNSTELQPVDQYRVEITFPAIEGTPAFTQMTMFDSKITFHTVPYVQDKVDYSTANITVVVCAINERGEACSDMVYHKGVERAGSGPKGNAISGGGIAAIVIFLLLLFCVGIALLILLLYLCYRHFWKDYYPGSREKKNEQQFMVTRSVRYEDDV